VPSAPHGHRGEAAAALGACLPDLTDVTRLSIQPFSVVKPIDAKKHCTQFALGGFLRTMIVCVIASMGFTTLSILKRWKGWVIEHSLALPRRRPWTLFSP
jgi:hypothetical protein